MVIYGNATHFKKKKEKKQKMSTTIIPVIVFTPPSGKQEQKNPEFSDPDGTLAKTMEILTNCHCRITAEILRLGGLSICIEEFDLGDFDCELCGSTVQEIETAVNKLLGRFDLDTFDKWKKGMSRGQYA